MLLLRSHARSLARSHARPVTQEQAAPTRRQSQHTRPIAAAAERAKSSPGSLPCVHVPEGPALSAKSIESVGTAAADHAWNHSLGSEEGRGHLHLAVGAPTHQPMPAHLGAAFALIGFPPPNPTSRTLSSGLLRSCLQGRASRSHGTGRREGQARAECGAIDELR